MRWWVGVTLFAVLICFFFSFVSIQPSAITYNNIQETSGAETEITDVSLFNSDNDSDTSSLPIEVWPEMPESTTQDTGTYVHKLWSEVELIVVSVETVNGAIGHPIVNHNPLLCINPPPYGQQCTMHEEDALLSCLRLRGPHAILPCVALTCPSRADYEHLRARPDRGMHGPVCQARGDVVITDYGHGMCSASGCCNIFFFYHQYEFHFGVSIV